MIKNKYKISIFILLFLLLTGAFAYSYISQPNIDHMSYSTFITYLEAGQIKNIDILNNDYLHITLNNNEVFQVPNPQKENMKEYFLVNGAEVGNKVDYNQGIIRVIGVGAIGVGIFYYFKKVKGKDAIELVDYKSQGSTRNDLYTFDSVAGNEEAKDMVKDIIDFIRNPNKYTHIGAKMPKGLLLYGPPGTGKTLMAKAIAGEANVPFYAVSGSDFIQMYVGVGASRIRQLFKKAKKSQKAVIFIDEIDAIGKKRGNGITQNNDERDQTLNALLTEMSGFNQNQGIVVIAATNRVDSLDEALIRPGRFDRMIEIGLPDIKARTRILNLHLQGKPKNSEVNIENIAKETVYFSGAMLENLVNEAAIIAANSNEIEINSNNFDEAFYRVIAGMAKKDRSTINKKDKEITAYHEAGHALATKLLLPDNTVSKVTIIPSTKGYGGFSMSIPEDRLYKTKTHILSDIKVLLAGRAAEELVFGLDYITTGASNDITKASQLIKDFVVKYGMHEDYGLFNMESVEMQLDSDILKKCRTEVNRYYLEVKKLLESNKELLHSISDALIYKETLYSKDIEELCNSKIVFRANA